MRECERQKRDSSPLQPIRKHEPILGLDLIRFLAALLVVGLHLAWRPYSNPGDQFHYLGKTALGSFPAGAVAQIGWIGVQVFFVISGFVIAYSSEDATAAKFMRRRFMRLWPTMFVAATVCAAVSIVFWGAQPRITSLLWLKSVTFYWKGPWLSPPFWTLPIEVSFYVIVLGVVLVGFDALVRPLCYSLATVSAAYWLGYVSGVVSPGFLARGTQLLLLQHGCYFSLGMVLWLRARRGPSPYLSITALICVVTSVVQVITTQRFERTPGSDYPPLVPVAVFLTMLFCIQASIAYRGHIAKFLGDKGAGLVKRIGLSTYPLYLVHNNVGGGVLVACSLLGLNALESVTLAVFASIAAAWIIQLYLAPAVERGLVLAAPKLFGGRPVG